jgi:hypothetical protein
MPSKETVNRIVFIKKHYRNPEDLYIRISQQINLLMETGYICVVFEVSSLEGAIILEFNPNTKNEELQYPYWLFPDEIEYLVPYQRDVEIEQHKDEINKLESEKEDKEEEDILESLIKPKNNKNSGGSGGDA